MDDTNIIDSYGNNNELLSLYKAQGVIEGRVTALENTSKEVKELLNSMSQQLNLIQLSVSDFYGKHKGMESAAKFIGNIFTFMVNIAITVGVAYTTLKYGK